MLNWGIVKIILSLLFYSIASSDYSSFVYINICFTTVVSSLLFDLRGNLHTVPTALMQVTSSLSVSPLLSFSFSTQL